MPAGALDLTDDELVDRFVHVTRWRRGDHRAPHKPLLLLLALARVQRGESRLVRFVEIEQPLRDLLDEYGPPRDSQHPEEPFWRLRNDRLWEIPEAGQLVVNASGSVSVRQLRDVDAHGGLREDVFEHLRVAPALVNRIAAEILASAFPQSLHESILDTVAMPFVALTAPRRDPAFRDLVLRLYEYRCAVCGYDGRLGRAELALEAAHVRWFAYDGPDTADNGLALCSFHHQALDRGAIGLDDDHRILVSQSVHGGPAVTDWLLRFHGAPLRGPQPGQPRPAPPHLAWHRTEVFRAPARVL